MTSKTAKVKAERRSNKYKLYSARLQGVEALRELLMTDEDARNSVMEKVEPWEDLEVEVNDFIKGVRQERYQMEREGKATIDDYAQDKRAMKAITKELDKL